MQIPNSNKAVALGSQEQIEELEKINKLATEIASLYKASQSWFWRIIVIIVSLATVISAAFGVLSYFKR